MTTYRVEMSVVKTTKHNVYKDIEADSFDEAKAKAKELVEDFGNDVYDDEEFVNERVDAQLTSVMAVVDSLDMNIIDSTGKDTTSRRPNGD